MIILLGGLPVMSYEKWQLRKSEGLGFDLLAEARLALIKSIQGRIRVSLLCCCI
jgi:hypothetical protein